MGWVGARNMAQQVEALAAYAWGPEFDFQNPQKTGKEKKRTNSPELPSDPHLHTVRCMHPPHTIVQVIWKFVAVHQLKGWLSEFCLFLHL